METGSVDVMRCSFCNITRDEEPRYFLGPPPLSMCGRCVEAAEALLRGEAPSDTTLRRARGESRRCRFCFEEKELFIVGQSAEICERCTGLMGELLVE